MVMIVPTFCSVYGVIEISNPPVARRVVPA
jgi:hypothetical protein